MAWAPDYATSEELAAYMRIGDTLDAAVLSRAVTAASRAVDKATNRQFGLVAAPEARVYPACWDSSTGRWSARIDDLMTTSGLVVATDPDEDESWTGAVGTAYVLRERNAPSRGVPWVWLDITGASSVQPAGRERLVQVTGLWGWTAVPSTVVNATLLQGSRFASRRDSPYGIAGTGDQSPALRLQERADPDVVTMLRPYRRGWWAA